MDHSPGAVTRRLRPLLLAVHEALSAGVRVSAAVHDRHGWNPTADRHLDHQLVRREAMERLRPWGAGPDELTDPLQARQLDLDTSTDNLGLPMSGLILRTPTDVLRVWRSDDGELPAAATDGLRAFYRQDPSRQLQLAVGPQPPRAAPGHLALLWADAGAVLTRFDLVRPCGHVGRRVQVDWHVDLRERLGRPPPDITLREARTENAPSVPEIGYSPSPASGADALSRRCRMATLLWILAVVLVVAGIVAIVRKQLLWGIVLIVVGLLVGPGGVSVFT